MKNIQKLFFSEKASGMDSFIATYSTWAAGLQPELLKTFWRVQSPECISRFKICGSIDVSVINAITSYNYNIMYNYS